MATQIIDFSRNIVSSINYEAHDIDDFVMSPHRRRRKSSESSTIQSANETKSETASERKRRSTRDRNKKEQSISRSRVRYDMQFVPLVQRNKAFLQSFPEWYKSQSSSTDPHRNNCQYCEGLSAKPFLNEDTVVWIPSKRSEWDDCISELTGVCTSSAFRRYLNQPKDANTKPFYPPLSKEYIRDRVDIDDPLRGYQLRHKTGGWLQGFVLWTNFTTWTYSYRWDSLHEASGISKDDYERFVVDEDGSLAQELEGLARAGDPHGGGIVFPDIAEIGLVGALGCGEYLVRMALDAIRAANKYKYVVLQATDASKTFYERFGFVRVGAICRYTPCSNEETPMVGYRHWTHANESDKSLELHGGPSYMMCLKLPTEDAEPDLCSSRTRSRDHGMSATFLEEMLKYEVDEKPRVTQVGGPWSPMSSPYVSGQKRGPGRPRSVTQDTMPALSLGKRALIHDADSVSTGKRRRFNSVSSDEVSNPEFVVKIPKRRGRPPKNKSTSLVSVPRKRGRPRKGSTLGRPASKGIPKSTEFLSPQKSGRTVHSERGSDGRFSQTQQSPTKTEQIRAAQKIVAPSHGVLTSVDKKSLVKQRVKSYPRSRVHYYNRVVKRKSEPSKYYFVLEYDEGDETIIIVPMEARGSLTGKREGRPRYQASLTNTNENFIKAKAKEFDVVNSTMVMKTPIVSQEAWDIVD